MRVHTINLRVSGSGVVSNGTETIRDTVRETVKEARKAARANHPKLQRKLPKKSNPTSKRCAKTSRSWPNGSA